jgi:hypothetical protein
MKVKKRDGSTEDWSLDKVVTSVSKTGVPLEDAKEIAQSIETWATENAVEGSIESTKLRDKVAELLRPDYPAEANSYLAYKKS